MDFLKRSMNSRDSNPTILNIIQWDEGMIDPLSDGLMFFLINWEKFSETMGR